MSLQVSHILYLAVREKALCYWQWMIMIGWELFIESRQISPNKYFSLALMNPGLNVFFLVIFYLTWLLNCLWLLHLMAWAASLKIFQYVDQQGCNFLWGWGKHVPLIFPKYSFCPPHFYSFRLIFLLKSLWTLSSDCTATISPDERRWELIKCSSESPSVISLLSKRWAEWAASFISQATYRLPCLIGKGSWDCMQTNFTNLF